MFSFIFPVLFSLAGSLFLAIAWRSGGQTLLILNKGVKAQGMIVQNVRRPLRTGERVTATSLAPVVQFKTHLDEQITFYSQDYTTPSRYEVGQMIDIWYLPDDPKTASLNERAIWILPLSFGVFGLVLSLIGFPMLFRVLFKF